MNLEPVTDLLHVRSQKARHLFLAIYFAEHESYKHFYLHIFEYLVLNDELQLKAKYLRLHHEDFLYDLLYGLG
jgi:hypothetical protein